MASYPLPLSISVLQSNWSSLRPTTSHLLRFSSLLSSHCKPYEAQNAPHVVGTMPSKSITAVQAPRSPQILLFFTSVQPVGSQGVELIVGDGVGSDVGGGDGVGEGDGSFVAGDGAGGSVRDGDGAPMGAVVGDGVGGGGPVGAEGGCVGGSAQ